MRQGLSGLRRFIATPITSKHRFFVWLSTEVLPSVSVNAIARDDDYTFGVLHSRAHILWALRLGTQLEYRPRYTPPTTFETFPFPRPARDQRVKIGAAARRLHELRTVWLHPRDAFEEEGEQRTLTTLYNEMPAWLRDVHAALDDDVVAAYGWSTDLDVERLVERLLDLNQARARSGTTEDQRITASAATSP